MNNRPIDYVLSVPPTRSDAAFALVRPREDAPRFDSHFRQESEAREPSSPPPTRPPAEQPQQRPPRSDDRDDAAADRPLPQSSDAAPSADVKRDEDDHDSKESADAIGSDGQSTPVVAAVSAEQHVADKAEAVDEAAAEPHVDADGKQKLAGKEVPKKGVPIKSRAIDLPVDTQPEAAPAEAVGGAIDPDAAVPTDPTAIATVVQANEKPAASSTDSLPAVAIDETAVDAEATEATTSKEADSQPRVKTKANKHADGHVAAAPTDAHEEVSKEVQAQARPAVPDRTLQTAAIVSGEHPAAAGSATKGKEEKHVDAKATLATNDDATSCEPSPGRPTVAATNRATAINPTVPVAANIDPSQPTAGTSLDAPESDVKAQQVKPLAKDGLLSPLARLERGGPLNAHANRTGGNREAGPHVDPARFVSRVARAVQTAHERGTPLQLRLSPPELGTMRLELTVRGGALTASIETDNANARQVLLDNLPALRDRLAEQSVRIERFDVDVRRDGTGDGSGGGGRPNTGPQEQGHNQHRHAAPHRTNVGRGSTNQTTGDTPAPIRRTITNTSINVIA
jgi:flagellar hook-length control protein FliK